MATSTSPTARSSQSSGTAGRRAIKKIKEQLTCSMCSEMLSDPRLLPCHHSFCLTCLQGLLPPGGGVVPMLGRGPEGAMVQQGGRVLRCPSCTKEVYLVGEVSDLPPDFKSNSLLEYFGASPDSRAKAPAADEPALLVDDSAWGSVTCPMCETVYTDPRRLDCGHTFCSACLQFLLPLNETLIHCPCCTGTTVVAGGVEGLHLDVEKITHVTRSLQEDGAALEGGARTTAEVQQQGQGFSPEEFTRPPPTAPSVEDIHISYTNCDIRQPTRVVIRQPMSSAQDGDNQDSMCCSWCCWRS